MQNIQPGILQPVPRIARYLCFSLKPGADPQDTVRRLGQAVDGDTVVVGLGESLIRALGADLAGLRTFPVHTGTGIDIPSTPFALWCWCRGEDNGEVVHRARFLQSMLVDAFRIENVIDAFRYGPGLDLTGYEDGTENPEGDDAIDAGIVRATEAGMDGSSFVAVQQWVHDLTRFQTMPQNEQDATIGRRKSDNEELDDAPVSAHVKRTAQEDFEPEAFVLRRSMPWADATREGLVFVAFGKSFDAFEALLKRMVGAEDGVTDALFRFTRPISGSYFWCPPIAGGSLDLTALGL